MTLRRSTRLLGWSLAACAPALAAATTERPLPLVVAVGPEIRADPEWRHDLGRAVAYCQQTLGEAVAGRFRVREVVAWQPRGSTLEQMLASLRRQVPPRPDVLVLGLTRRHAAPENEWGLSSYREALALVTTWRTGGRYGPALAHEIGHLFGAVHVETAGCVMAGASPGARLSPLNAARCGSTATAPCRPTAFRSRPTASPRPSSCTGAPPRRIPGRSRCWRRPRWKPATTTAPWPPPGR
jgi:hypothetical protein